LTTTPKDSPAFGAADLSDCEREQIHLPESIQPHGALLVLRGPQLKVVKASSNLNAVTGIDADALGRPFADYDAPLAETILSLLKEEGLESMPQSLRSASGRSPYHFDVAVHRLESGDAIVELEPVRPGADLTGFIEQSFQSILSTLTLRDLCDETARVFKKLTGYDRVMVYRFDPDGHGEVFSEQREDTLEAYLGNRYPASDIPQIARRLYQTNRIRLLVDVSYRAIPLIAGDDAIHDGQLDMSLCSLRSVSPIHIQYLKNMGVSATLVVSLMAGGSLWGLVSCHHYSPRNIAYETKAACEVLAEVVATRIAALESFARVEGELAIRRIEKRIVEAIARDGNWKRALFDNPQLLLQPLQAIGAALAFEGEILSTGEVPGTEQIRAIVSWLERTQDKEAFASSCLGSDWPEFKPLKSVASGLLSVPISRAPGEYLMWFRPERIRTLTWGGNPFKPVEVGDDPRDLSPRRSFAQWHQLVQDTSDQWSNADLMAAKLIGESLEDLIYQFRAVRMLIAQDQVAQIKREVQSAHQPIIIGDDSGQLLFVNDAFYKLACPSSRHLRSIDDLPELFSDEAAARDMLETVMRDHQPWRGEIDIASGQGQIRTLMLRVDPVFSGGYRILGFVLFFADTTDRKVLEVARKNFQDGIAQEHRASEPSLDSQTDLLFRNLTAKIVNNAKLAALEISDGAELESVPKMLESVRDSAMRTRALLRHLLTRRTM
jgi:light-regulated signal transduction histidine kinase (bacteriophytochrome)